MLSRHCASLVRPASLLRPALVARARQATPARTFCAVAKLRTELAGELQHEQGGYEQPDAIKKFMSSPDWKFEEKPNNVNMTLKRETGNFIVSVDFQLVSPVSDMPEEEGGEEDDYPPETTDFSITVENKTQGGGLILYCSTTPPTGEDGAEPHRFVIGNMRTFSSPEEKEDPAAYNGPEFEDLDEKLQETLDEWLSSLGVDPSLIDFIDAMAVDKEQREYITWLQNLSKLVG